MIVAEIEGSVFDYEDEKNIMVLPITAFIRKDGKVASSNNITKEFFNKYPSLSKKWAYMLENNVIYPTFVSSKSELIGIVEKLHYAASPDEESILNGLWYIKELSLRKPDYLFYIIEMGGEAQSYMFKDVFKDSDNVVLLKKRKEVDDE